MKSKGPANNNFYNLYYLNYLLNNVFLIFQQQILYFSYEQNHIVFPGQKSAYSLLVSTICHQGDTNQKQTPT